jgi:hypothetical protein
MAVETLGQAYEGGWRISVRCAHGPMRGMKRVRPCQVHGELDLDTLIWTRGEGLPLDQLEDLLKCPNCWSRRVVVRIDRNANVKRPMKVTPQ